MKLDIEGTGKPQLYQFICAGSNYTLLDFYEADETPYAILELTQNLMLSLVLQLLICVYQTRTQQPHKRYFGQCCFG